MSQIKPPKFLADLYADLRDRHLLIPAIALVVAIFAVPVLLKSSSDPKPSPSAAAPANATSIQPAVLASNQVGVRDYRKRLADLKSKNPFKQQFAATPTTATTTGTAGAGTAGTTSSSGTTASGVSASPIPGGPPSSVATGTPPPSTFPSGSGSNGDNGNGNGSGNNTEVVHQLFTRRVDVKVGVQGDQKLRKGVKPMTILPDDTTPVVAFLGTDEAGKRAAFVVSSDVTAVSGVGTCVPSLADCLYVTLRKGEQVSLDYAPDGQTYVLKLVDIRDVKVKQ
jgi:hypothetical protein